MYSHHLMALGFAGALFALLYIRRFGGAVLCLIAVAESYACIRYPFHVIVRDYLLHHVAQHIGKIQLQVIMLMGIAAVAALWLLVLMPRLRRMAPGARMRALGAFIIVAMFGIELVSLHFVDTIVYQMIGPFARCAIVYFIGALFVIGGAAIEGRRRYPARQPA